VQLFLKLDGTLIMHSRTEPEDLPGTGISRMLHPDHSEIFKEATKQLQADDSHTIEVKFLLRVNQDEGISASRFQLMEGKGMLMVDREDGHPSHTMWVIKPATSSDSTTRLAPDELPSDATGDPEGDDGSDGTSPECDPCPVPINVTPILCRICECNIPQWYFERHNETCVETHRLEADIMDCNETIGELRSTIKELIALIDRTSPASAPEYRGMPILSPSTSPGNPSPLSLFRGPLSSKVQKMGVKKMQRRFLEQLDDILQLAAEVEIPTLRDEESKEPIERQTLLSPSSERKMTQVRNWFKPSTEDSGLRQLLDDSDRVMRSKMDNVIRMRNTIKYSEKVRQEWEERVRLLLPRPEEIPEDDITADESMVTETDPLDDEEDVHDDASSTTSEYAFNGEDNTIEVTPIASTSPTPYSMPPPAEIHRVSPELAPLVAPRPHAPQSTRQAVSSMHHTRSSTPASVISSPLALVPPIVASPSPPPPMSLNDDLPLVSSATTIRSRRSTPSLQSQPRLLLTPPASPAPGNANKDSDASRKLHRRKSTTANAILSPTTSTVPLSPRAAAPPSVPRAAATSIKDFDIIKPISKGAFGSVFLAKKKATGDYYAIKVLKKADMIAKNQVTNVKAERMILMTQADSPFVAKLYFTFQNKENLFLVMEYLNGGDCNNLVQALGTLPEEWAKNYVAEVVLGLESLHRRGIVHR
jgi:serine/threonine-protein kinase RIM15